MDYQWIKDKLSYLKTFLNKYATWLLRGVYIVLVVGFLLVVGFAIYLYLDPSTPEQKQNYVKIILQLIGGLIVFFGAYVGWKKVEANWKSLEINQEGQITDRFIRANEQLGAVDQNGNPKIETRLGGIYALEQLDWERKDYHWTIMEILSAYVRENSPLKNKKENESRTDIKAIITVIGKRKWVDEEKFHEKKIDLNRTNLAYCELRGYFENVDFLAANLSSANIIEANLKETMLLDAKLDYALILRSSLSHAILSRANLSKADMSESDFSGAELLKANLSKVNFDNTNLSEANLSEAEFFNTNLSGAIMYRTEGLTQEQINEAYGDESTKLPKHLERPAHWLSNPDGSEE